MQGNTTVLCTRRMMQVSEYETMQLPPLPAERQSLARSFFERLAEAAPKETGEPGEAIDTLAVGMDGVARSYVAALLDILAYLGTIERDLSTSMVRVTSPQAGYFLRMLIALLDTGVPLVTDWTREGVTSVPSHPFGKAVDLLASLEQRRLELVPDAEPLRETYAAIGVITRRLPSGEREFLLYWDEDAAMWQMIGGRFEARDGSLRTTMVRELAEELACAPVAEDVHVTIREIGPPFSVERVSPTYGLLTRTTFQAYTVRFLVTEPALHAGLRWVREPELLAGATADGQPISSAPFRRILDQSGRDVELL